MSVGFSIGTFERISAGLFRLKFDKSAALSVRRATGLEKLASEVLFFLLTTEGSIHDDPTCGTLLGTYIGTLPIGGSEKEIASLLAIEVHKAESRIKFRQAAAALPPSEKLARIVLDEVEVDGEQAEATLRIAIVNQLEQAVGLEVPTAVITGSF